MVDSHEKNGQQFDSTSVEDVPMAGEPVALRRSGAEAAGKAGEGCLEGSESEKLSVDVHGRRREELVAKDVDVVAWIDEEYGQEVGVANGAVFLDAGEPFEDVAVAAVGGDRDEESATCFGSSTANGSFGVDGFAVDGYGVVGDIESGKEFVHEEDVVVPFVVQA